MTFQSQSCGSAAKPSHGRGILGLAAAAFLILPLPGGTPQAGEAQGYVLTADEQGNSVSRVDLTTKEVSTVALPIGPHNVQVTPDMQRLLVVGSPAEAGHGGHGGNHHGQSPGRLLLLDPLALKTAPLEIVVGNHPAHVVTDPEGRRAFVTNSGDDTIAVVDLAAGRVVANIPTGDYPHGLRLAPDGRHLLVANVQDGTVSLIDIEKLSEAARIPVGAAPVQVAFLPDGSRAYVSLRDEDAVAVVDVAARAVLGRIPVGDGPIQLYATPDGSKVVVANQGSEATPSNEVSVIDVASGSVVTVKAGVGPHGVVISTDGAQAFVTNVNDGTLSVIDIATPKIIATYRVGKGPNGVTYLQR